MPTTRIGIDIGTTQVRVAQVETRPGRAPRLLRHGAIELEPGAVRDGVVHDEDAVADALRELWRRHRLRGADVVLGVGNEHVYVRELTVPDAPADELRGSLRFISGDLLPVELEDCVLDFQPSVRRGGEIEGLLVAAPEEVVRRAIAAAEGAKLRVVGVDLNVFALIRALLREQRARGTTALVDVGAGVTQIVVVQNSAARLVRFVRFGGDELTTGIVHRLRLTDEQARALKQRGPGGQPADIQAVFADHARALVDVVSQTVGYHEQAGGAPVERVVLAGRASRLPGLGQYVATATSLPVALGEVSESVQTGRLAADDDAGLAVAVGLGVAA